MLDQAINALHKLMSFHRVGSKMYFYYAQELILLQNRK